MAVSSQAAQQGVRVFCQTVPLMSSHKYTATGWQVVNAHTGRYGNVMGSPTHGGGCGRWGMPPATAAAPWGWAGRQAWRTGWVLPVRWGLNKGPSTLPHKVWGPQPLGRYNGKREFEERTHGRMRCRRAYTARDV